MNAGTEGRDRGVTGAIETEREASHKATVRGARRPLRQRERRTTKPLCGRQIRETAGRETVAWVCAKLVEYASALAAGG